MGKKYIVRLTKEERERLNGLVSKGRASATQDQTRACVAESGCRRTGLDGPVVGGCVRDARKHGGGHPPTIRRRGSGCGAGAKAAG